MNDLIEHIEHTYTDTTGARVAVSIAFGGDKALALVYHTRAGVVYCEGHGASYFDHLAAATARGEREEWLEGFAQFACAAHTINQQGV